MANVAQGNVLGVDGSPIENLRVFVYRRDNGALLGSDLTDASGNFSVNTGVFSGDVFAIYRAAVDSEGDPLWSSVKLFLTCSGADGSTTFTDISPVGATVTRVDTTVSTAQNKFYSGSGLFNGGKRLSVPNLSLTLPFSIETHIYPITSNPLGLFDTAPSAGGTIRNYNSGQIEKQGGTAITFNPPAGEWSWVQLIFKEVSGNLHCDYIRNGSLVTTGQIGSGLSFTQGANFVIGGINNGGDGSLNAYISEFRVTNAARSASNPVAAQLLDTVATDFSPLKNDLVRRFPTEVV